MRALVVGGALGALAAIWIVVYTWVDQPLGRAGVARMSAMMPDTKPYLAGFFFDDEDHVWVVRAPEDVSTGALRIAWWLWCGFDVRSRTILARRTMKRSPGIHWRPEDLGGTR